MTNHKSLLNITIIVCASILILYIGFSIISSWLIDDAFISYRYVQNLFQDNGFVYNHGENIQGYTNFLYIIFILFLTQFDISISNSSIFINILSYLILSVFTYLYIKKRFNNKFFDIMLPTLLIISAPNLVCWSIGGGLEGPLFSVLIFLSFYFLLNTDSWKTNLFSSGFLGLATLARPEGFLFFIISLFYSLFISKRKNILFFLLGYLLIVIPYLIWVLSYYGDLLPNSFYAKVYSQPFQFYNGIHYLYRYFMSSPFVLICLIISLLNFNKLGREYKLFVIIIVVFSLYIIYVGGDWMPGYRFFIPLVPFLFLLVHYWINKLFSTNSSNHSYPIQHIIFFVLIIYNLLSSSYFYDYKLRIQAEKVKNHGKELAEYFDYNYSGNFSIAASAIGELGFYSKMKIIDVLGIVDTAVSRSGEVGLDELLSHNKSNSDYILKLKPDIILFGLPPGVKESDRFAESKIFSDKYFKQNYLFIEDSIASGSIARYYLLKDNQK